MTKPDLTLNDALDIFCDMLEYGIKKYRNQQLPPPVAVAEPPAPATIEDTNGRGMKERDKPEKEDKKLKRSDVMKTAKKAAKGAPVRPLPADDDDDSDLDI